MGFGISCFFTAKRSVRFLLASLLMIVFYSCVPPGTADDADAFTGVTIDLKDPVTRKLANWQDQRLTDSLLTFLRHENPSYRYYAASAFGSFTAEKAQQPLVDLLNDPVDLVRSAAAYALGQQQTEDEALGETLVSNFRLDSTNRKRESFAHLLQAIGKQGSEKRLDQLSTVSNYSLRDTNLLEGLSWSIFYYARRGIMTESGTDRALELAQPKYPEEVRFPALSYLARFVEALDSSQVTPLVAQLARESSADLRMLIARSIAKYKGGNSLNALKGQLGREKDWRVRSDIVRSLGGYPYPDFKESVLGALNDAHELVAEQAANTLLYKGVSQDATLYWKLGRDSFPWSVRYKLYEAANQHLPVYFADYRSSITYQLQQAFQKTNDSYQQAAIISALAAFPWNYRIIMDLGLNNNSKAVQTTTISSLARISGRKDFDEFFRGSSSRVRAELSEAFRRAIESGDAGMVYEAAQPLSIEKENPYLNSYPDLGWAKTALDKLPLPETVESYRALQNAINRLEGKPKITDFPAPTYSHPIEWAALEAAGDAPTVRIHTNKGKIDVELWPELAPGTVSNFLDLARSDFYKGKYYHRVVPNFVVQGGDPRGDGYGSVDFSIRTETPQAHWSRAGLIGMASAGRDTESIQFFITHSSTPHLDGNYTIFGEVIKGQDIVDALRMGDVIERVEVR